MQSTSTILTMLNEVLTTELTSINQYLKHWPMSSLQSINIFYMPVCTKIGDLIL